MNVLVVDDHPIVLQGCRRVLEDAGVEAVHEATGVVAGYRSFRRHRPAVVVADLTFQGNTLSGLELIRRIRKEREERLAQRNESLPEAAE